MVKKIKKSLKSNNKNEVSKYKKKLNFVTIKRGKKRIVKNTFYDKDEFVTDLSFIDKYEEDEKERIKIKENENIIKFQNKKAYFLKICYRPLTNNIELIGRYFEENNYSNSANNNEKSLLNLNNKCSYLFNQYNNVVAPILYENIFNIENNNKNNINNNFENKNNVLNENGDEVQEKIEIQKLKRKKRKSSSKNKKQFFYLHICKKNIISCLLLNEYSLINYIVAFLSGMYSGYFEELNKNDKSELKVDSFNIFLNLSDKISNDDFYNIDVLGRGKDKYGEYLIKGSLKLIHNLTQYNKENDINDIKNNDKVIKFGNIFFHKIYNLK